MDDKIDSTPARDDAATADAIRNMDRTAMNDEDKTRAKELVHRVGHGIELTPENSSRIYRKINLRILPIILFVYFLQVSSVSFEQQQSPKSDLHRPLIKRL